MNVSVFTVSSTELEVTWTEVPAIHRNGIITRYEILYEPLNTFEGLIGFNNVTVLHPGLIDTLTGLEEDVEYNVSIRAYTVVGPGPYSGPVSNRTLQDGKSESTYLPYETIMVKSMSYCVIGILAHM